MTGSHPPKRSLTTPLLEIFEEVKDHVCDHPDADADAAGVRGRTNAQLDVTRAELPDPCGAVTWQQLPTVKKPRIVAHVFPAIRPVNADSLSSHRLCPFEALLTGDGGGLIKRSTRNSEATSP